MAFHPTRKPGEKAVFKSTLNSIIEQRSIIAIGQALLPLLKKAGIYSEEYGIKQFKGRWLKSNRLNYMDIAKFQAFWR